LIAYMQSDGKKPLWEFLPLRGDPTPEEREQLLKDAHVEKEAKDNDFARSVLADFKNRGLI
jgi:hypothetical protein